MTGVWMSDVRNNYQLGYNLGTRTKMYGRDWDPATKYVPVATPDELRAMNLQARGFTIPRSSFPEADAVYNEKLFSRVGELFASAGFLVAREKLASVISKFDLGDGGLIPFPIYKDDLTTPYDEKFFIINFGARKNTINIDLCEDTRRFYIEKDSNRQIWKLNYTNDKGRVVLSETALCGADIWVEEIVSGKLFISDRLVRELEIAGLAEDWSLLQCHVTGVA